VIELKVVFNRPSFVGGEIHNIIESVANGHISGNGKFTKLSEKLLTDLFSNPTLLTTNCTHSLEMCAKLLKLDSSDEVIVPSYTFVSTANAFAQNGSKIVFADINLNDFNVSIEAVEKLITKKTKAICIVHYGGAGATPDEFRILCDNYKLVLIEDNAHGLGGKFKNKYLGTFGELSTLSFHETKNIICGEGGATVITDSNYLERAKILRDKGTDRANFLQGIVDKYTWVDDGSSWVMSDVLAAFLYSQLRNIEKINQRRREIWDTYKKELTNWASLNYVQIPDYPSHVEHTSHLFFLRFQTKEIRNRFISHMSENGVQTPFHYQALHDTPIGKKFGSKYCPNSSEVSETLVRLPIYLSLTTLEVEYVIEKVKSFK
jgi:dTDP-4-amino-4,6-dideoxygalactose transaminase